MAAVYRSDTEADPPFCATCARLADQSASDDDARDRALLGLLEERLYSREHRTPYGLA